MGSFNDEDTQTLVKLGLNGSQSKIYLTLVSLRVANAKEQFMSIEIADQVKKISKKVPLAKLRKENQARKKCYHSSRLLATSFFIVSSISR